MENPDDRHVLVGMRVVNRVGAMECDAQAMFDRRPGRLTFGKGQHLFADFVQLFDQSVGSRFRGVSCDIGPDL